MGAAQRFDATRVDRAERLSSGALRIDARPTRTGVLLYHRPDGSTIRELRPAAEVFSPDSLASLRGVATTVQHPDQPVSPDTWAEHAVGHVGDDVRADGSHVAASLVVQHAPAIDGVMSEGPNALRELSCGYSCELDPTPGLFEGQQYDAIQRNIRYNHVALLRSGEGRAGPSASLRFDSAIVAVSVKDEIKPMGVKIKVDGREFEEGSAAHLAYLDDRIAAQTARADKAEGELAATKAALVTAKEPKAFSAEVLRRVRLVSDCSRLAHASSVKFDADEASGSADPIAMIVALLKEVAPSIDLEGKSPDFVLGVLASKLGELGAGAGEPDGDEPDSTGYDGGPGSTGSGITGQSPPLAPGHKDSRTARAAAQAPGGTHVAPVSVADAIDKARANSRPWESPMAANKGA